MKLVSFDAMRSCNVPGTIYIKPENAAAHVELIRRADFLLFPEYWQINGLYYGLKKRLYPSISAYHLGHDKIEMTRTVQMLWPRHLPETYIVPNSPWASAWVLERLDFPFIAKTARESMGRGVWLIGGVADWERYRQSHPVLYVQEHLPIERDMRLVVVGRKVVSAYWKCMAPDGIHTNVARGGTIEPGGVPDAAIRLVEEMARHLDIDYAGFDVAEVDGHYYFFEFNRMFGTAGLQRQGVSIGPLILDYLRSKTGSATVPFPYPGADEYHQAS
jgi:ribosomal protein S6--L-glutamate ligase